VTGEEKHPGSIRSYVLRQGRFTDAQRAARERLLPRYGIPFHAEPIDLASTFARAAPTVLEIGFGMGETTAEIAQANPQANYLGIEVHAPGVGSLLRLIEARGLGNVRIIQHDAVEVVQAMIAPRTLAGIHIFFPDPWPKKRHHKRRLFDAGTTRHLERILAPGGYLHVSTDFEEYFEAIVSVVESGTSLKRAQDPEFPAVPAGGNTNYEAKYLAAGRRIHRATWRK
jgi:tRNA (guanine-N7-)-methyltransferase